MSPVDEYRMRMNFRRVMDVEAICESKFHVLYPILITVSARVGENERLTAAQIIKALDETKKAVLEGTYFQPYEDEGGLPDVATKE